RARACGPSRGRRADRDDGRRRAVRRPAARRPGRRVDAARAEGRAARHPLTIHHGGALVGVLGVGIAAVDSTGRIEPGRAAWWRDWWIGADDRWPLPEREVAVRQSITPEAPLVETAMRVPRGDARHRVYGAGGEPPALVVEVENDSPAPFVLALVVRGA